jgi:WD40 repeat protein
MPRLTSRLFLLVPIALVSLAVGVWVRQLLVPPPPPPGPPPVELATFTGPGGVRFEVEHRPGDYTMNATNDSVGVRRGPDTLDWEDDVLTVNGTGLPSPKPGDVVRWNLDGPLLINRQPQAPHPLQPRLVAAPGIDLRWTVREGPNPRDTPSVGWSRAGRVLVSGNSDAAARVWDIDRFRVRTTIPLEPRKGEPGGFAVRAAVSPDGKRVAVANAAGGPVTLWDADTGKELGQLSGGRQPPEPGPGKTNGLAFVSDDWLLVSQGGELTARQGGGGAGAKVVPVGPVHAGFAPPFAVSADGKTAAANDGKAVTLYRLAVGPDGLTVARVGSPIGPVTEAGCVAVSADGGLVAVFDGSARLALYDGATGAVRQRLRWRATEGPAEGKQLPIRALAFAPDGKTLAVGEARTIRLYDVASGRERGEVASGTVRDLAYSADGATLAAGLEHAPGVRLWPAADLAAK